MQEWVICAQPRCGSFLSVAAYIRQGPGFAGFGVVCHAQAWSSRVWAELPAVVIQWCHTGTSEHGVSGGRGFG